MKQALQTRIFTTITGGNDDQSSLDKKAYAHEPESFLRHVCALAASKLADGLIDPKLVLSWLLNQIGAGVFWTGMLVPLRESGALLPQLMVARFLGRTRRHRWFWAGGALVQGLMAACIAIAVLVLEGPIAGAVCATMLAILAIARSVCSASYKDILGKTISSSRRGTATGLAGTVAAAGLLGFAGILITGWGDRFLVVVCAVFLASALWVCAGGIMAGLPERRGEIAEDETGVDYLRVLREDDQLIRFVAVRSLLIGTALAPPYLVVLQSDAALSALGGLLLASSLAALVSSFVWGRLADRSSRCVLQFAALAGGATLALVLVLDLNGATAHPLVLPLGLFGLMVAYHGVRLGRSTHLVDMAEAERRAAYTALSNTIVGLTLIAGGALFAALGAISPHWVIGLFAGMCFCAAIMARGLKEVQNG